MVLSLMQEKSVKIVEDAPIKHIVKGLCQRHYNEMSRLCNHVQDQGEDTQSIDNCNIVLFMFEYVVVVY